MTSYNYYSNNYDNKDKKKISIEINPLGYSNSKRKKDGITYFGFQTEEELNTNPYIDYLLGPKDQEYDEQFIGKHFQIRFDWEIKKYYIY